MGLGGKESRRCFGLRMGFNPTEKKFEANKVLGFGFRDWGLGFCILWPRLTFSVAGLQAMRQCYYASSVEVYGTLKDQSCHSHHRRRSPTLSPKP